MDIKQFTKQGKDIVVELDDEVEYIIPEAAEKDLERGAEKVLLVRVVDREPQTISARRIAWAFHKKGVIDYLDRK